MPYGITKYNAFAFELTPIVHAGRIRFHCLSCILVGFSFFSPFAANGTINKPAALFCRGDAQCGVINKLMVSNTAKLAGSLMSMQKLKRLHWRIFREIYRVSFYRFAASAQLSHIHLDRMWNVNWCRSHWHFVVKFAALISLFRSAVLTYTHITDGNFISHRRWK